MPPEVDAGFAGIHYEFTINKENVITNVETDDYILESFNTKMEWFYDEVESEGSAKTYEEKLNAVMEKGIDRLRKLDAKVEEKEKNKAKEEEDEDNSDESTVYLTSEETDKGELNKNHTQNFSLLDFVSCVLHIQFLSFFNIPKFL